MGIFDYILTFYTFPFLKGVLGEDILLAVISFLLFFGSPKHSGKSLFHVSIVLLQHMLLVSVSKSLVWFLANGEGLYVNYLSAVIVIIICGIVYSSKIEYGNLIISCVMLFSMYVHQTAIIMVPASFEVDNFSENVLPLSLLCRALLYGILYFFVKRYVYQKDRGIQFFMVGIILLTCSMGWIIATISAYAMPELTGSQLWCNCFINIALLIMEYLSYISFFYLREYFTEKNFAVEEREKREGMERMLDIYKKNHIYIRSIRHDMQNNIYTIRMLLEAGRQDKLNQYLDDIGQQLNKPPQQVFCDNVVVNILLNQALNQAAEKNIETRFKAMLPSNISIKDKDLATVLFNLLDNALEAVQKLPEGKEKWVSSDIFYRQGHIFISVENPFLDTPKKDGNGLLRTSKADSSEHGLGTHIIQRVTERYQGCFVYRIEDGVFIAEATMACQEREASEKNQGASL